MCFHEPREEYIDYLIVSFTHYYIHFLNVDSLFDAYVVYANFGR